MNRNTTNIEPRNFKTDCGTISTIIRVGEPHYVFVHGLGGDKNLFGPAFDHPQSAGKGFLSLDLLGFGESSRLDDSIPYTFDLQAKAVKSVLKQSGIERFNLVLHSMASALLPELLETANLDVQAIYLLETNLAPEDGEWSRELSEMPEDEYANYYKSLTRAARFVFNKQLRRKHAKQQVEDWSSCFAKADSRALRETAIELYKRTCNGQIIDAFKSFAGKVVYLRGIDNRQWGGYDLLMQLGIELVQVQDAGHYLMLDAPDIVYETIFVNVSEGKVDMTAESSPTGFASPT